MAVDTQYSYAVGKIRALEKRLLDRSRMERMIDARSPEEALKVLLEAGYESGSDDYSDVYGAINTFKTKKGVCYDFSTLFAAMSRSIGLETKVIRGNYVSGKRQEYHAWNEIYLKDEGKWIKLDSTFGYALNKDYFDNPDFDDDHVKIDEL